MYAEFLAAVQSTKVLIELVKGAKALSNHNELTTAVSEVNSKLMEAMTVALASQQTQSNQADEIAKLKSELRSIAAWESEATRYELRELSLGKFAYALRSELAKGSLIISSARPASRRTGRRCFS